MTLKFRVSDGPASAPWLSPDIEPGQVAAGSFTVVPTLTTGKAYDFRVRVWNDGTEDAVPWTDSTATGDFVPPLVGAAGLAWPLSGTGRTIVASTATNVRVQLVPQGTLYGLELQTAAGATIRTLASTLDPNFVDRRLVAVISPDGRTVAVLDYNVGSGTATADIVQAPSGTVLMGPGSTVPAYSTFLPNLTFVAQINPSEYAGLNFAFAPEQRALLLTSRTSTGDTLFSVLDLRAKPAHANRVSITNLTRSGVGRHLFSPAGDVLALIPTQANSTVELFELPSGQALAVTNNGHAAGSVTLTALTGQLSTTRPTAYGGITLTGMITTTGKTAIDPPFRSRCAVQVHLWIATPAGAGAENGPGNVKLPTNVAAQGASAYVGRLGRNQSAEVVVASQYVAPAMTSSTDHRCAFAEAYSVAGAVPAEAKQRPGPAFDPLTYAQVAQRNLVIVGPNSPYFVAPYALANEATDPVDVELALEAADPREVARLARFRKGTRPRPLDVTGAGFVDWPCGRLVGRDEVEPAPALAVRLEPGERRGVAVLIDVATEPPTDRLEVAAFHVVERRSDGRAGGVTVLAASNPDLLGTVRQAERPAACPVDLVARPVWAPDPAEGAGGARPALPEHSEGWLVVEVGNASPDPIEDLDLWLESHSLPEATIEPLAIEAVRLEPGDTLRTVWPVRVGSAAPGSHLVSLVARSPQHAPHRLLLTVPTVRDDR